jgi:hypothetical protein
MAAPEGYNALGKIGISYKGDYDSNTTYERLDAVEHNGSTYLAIKDAPDGAPRDDKVNWIYLAKGFSGDIGDSEITFTEAENRENINTGESVKTVFGKIKKFFADLTAPAFAQMITTKEDLLATKATGYVPDAKAVADAYTELNGKLANSFINYDQRIRLAIYTWNGNVVGGSTVCFGSIENYIPNGHVLVGLFLTPRCTVDITMSYYYTQIYAASKDFTGEIYYDALLVFIKS